MKTPIFDFVEKYALSDKVRFHMPGHKGNGFLGVEKYDITEIFGADSLFEADGIIKESEANATKLFNTAQTLYSTGGSTLCIQAMLYLATVYRPQNAQLLILASRKAHKAFVNACALLDCDVMWITSIEKSASICSDVINCEILERHLKGLSAPPSAVYITTPDYLGKMADVATLAETCHKYGTILIVDNAHGAYLHFLEGSMHPIALGADLCCDSAHKTLPVITGGAYLHIGKGVENRFCPHAKSAMSLFASTSPSYLILSSLDKCNEFLDKEIKKALQKALERVEKTKKRLLENGWCLEPSEPLKITIKAPIGVSGDALADKLRANNIECEYADRNFLVLMLSTYNTSDDCDRLLSSLGVNHREYGEDVLLPSLILPRVMSIREAVFSDSEIVPVEDALGRVCATPTVSCPPAIPIVISGEIITEEAIEMFKYYNIKRVEVVKA